MSFKNYLKFYFKRMPIITLILTAFVTKGGILGSAFSSIVGFFLVLVFYMPVANTILSLFCYPVYALFNKGANIDTYKDNGFKYVLALSLIWFYSFLVGSFFIGMLGVLAPESTQELFSEFNNIKESFHYLVGDSPLEFLFIILLIGVFIFKGIPKFITSLSNDIFIKIIYINIVLIFLDFILYYPLISTRVDILFYGAISSFFLVVPAIVVEYFYKEANCLEFNIKYISLIKLAILIVLYGAKVIISKIFYLGKEELLLISCTFYFAYIILMIFIINNDLPKKQQ